MTITKVVRFADLLIGTRFKLSASTDPANHGGVKVGRYASTGVDSIGQPIYGSRVKTDPDTLVYVQRVTP